MKNTVFQTTRQITIIIRLLVINYRWLIWGLVIIKLIWLVVEPTPPKNMKVSWEYHSQFKWKHKIHVPNQQPV